MSPIQWPGRIVMPMGGADAEDFGKRWEETFGPKPERVFTQTIDQMVGADLIQLDIELQDAHQELKEIQRAIELCALGDRPQSPGVETLRREQELIQRVAQLLTQRRLVDMALIPCVSRGCTSKAVTVVYWPGQTARMCVPCADRAMGVAKAMGFTLTVEAFAV